MLKEKGHRGTGPIIGPGAEGRKCTVRVHYGVARVVGMGALGRNLRVLQKGRPCCRWSFPSYYVCTPCGEPASVFQTLLCLKAVQSTGNQREQR